MKLWCATYLTFTFSFNAPYTNTASQLYTEYTDSYLKNALTDLPKDGTTYYAYCQIASGLTDLPELNTSFADQIVHLNISGYKADFIRAHSSPNIFAVEISLTKDHDWKFTVSENHDKLTAQCQNQECRKEVSVTLKADPVTLPNSPFEAAELVGWNDFQAATGAEKTDIVYKCNGEPADKNNPKAGQYQAWVMIKNLRGPVYQDGVAAFADSQDTTNTAELYVHYTAADPAITAQTGDNRPIELMMISVLVFSALAAAAFIVDSKRRLQQ